MNSVLETIFLYLLAAGVFYLMSLLLNNFYLIAIFFGLVAAPLFWEKIIRKISLKELGFILPHPFLKESVLGIFFLLLFALYHYLFLSKENNLLNLSLYSSFIWFSLAFSEEFFYRGIIQRRLAFLTGKYGGLILAALIFVFIGHPKVALIDNLILRLPFSVMLGYFYLRTQSLLIPVGLHGGFNILFA